MVFVSFFRSVADSALLFRLALTLEVISVVGMTVLSQRLAAFDQGLPPPDLLLFGYTADELNAYYETLGEEGCKAYIDFANWDLFPYMFGYSITLGAFLILSSRQWGHSEAIALLAPLTHTCDLVETYLQKQGCVVYPERLSEDVVRCASYAVRLKWALFSLAILYAVSGGVKYLCQRRQTQRQKSD